MIEVRVQLLIRIQTPEDAEFSAAEQLEQDVKAGGEKGDSYAILNMMPKMMGAVLAGPPRRRGPMGHVILDALAEAFQRRVAEHEVLSIDCSSGHMSGLYPGRPMVS